MAGGLDRFLPPPPPAILTLRKGLSGRGPCGRWARRRFAGCRGLFLTADRPTGKGGPAAVLLSVLCTFHEVSLGGTQDAQTAGVPPTAPPSARDGPESHFHFLFWSTPSLWWGASPSSVLTQGPAVSEISRLGSEPTWWSVGPGTEPQPERDTCLLSVEGALVDSRLSSP